MTEQTSKTIEKRQPVSIIAIGAGNRMRTYMHYIENHPDEVRLVAIVEPDALRRESLAARYGIAPEYRFSDCAQLFAKHVEADAVMICTPENEHVAPFMLSAGRGYHVLLEKPIAQNLAECEAMQRATEQSGVKVSVCHVLRYHPLYVKVKELIDSGDYGKVISLTHTEGVGIDRTSHAYVRGIFNSEQKSNPMLLAKCCHDVDLLLWLTGRRCKRVSSMGSLRWFCEKNAPEGSAARCVDCSVEASCPYSAVDLYRRRKEWVRNFNVPEGSSLEAVIELELQSGPYGRCVYRCDNDVVDNQVVTMELDDATTVTLHMDIFTNSPGRHTHIYMSEGEIYCDETRVVACRFVDGSRKEFDFSEVAKMAFHGGSDLRVIENFVHAVGDKTEQIASSLEASIHSHAVCYAAERSRKNRVVEEL